MTKNEPLTVDLFGKALDRLIEMVVLGTVHVKIGRGLGQLLSADPAIAHVAPVFWGMSMTAHLDIAQLIAFKLFDARQGTLTIEHLLDDAGKLKDSFPHGTPEQVHAVISIARSQIEGILTDPLKKIRAKRNRVLAHVDRTIVSNPEKLAQDVAVRFSDLDLCLKTAGRVLNDLSGKLRNNSSHYGMINEDDYELAISLITEAKCAQIRSYEAQFGPWDGLRPKKC